MKKKLDKYLTYFKIKINTKIFEEKKYFTSVYDKSRPLIKYIC